MNGLKRAVAIAVMAVVGLAACGDDTNSPAPAGTNPAPVGTEAMTDKTEVMTDSTEAMTDKTEVMTDASTSTTGG